uniref:Uncharacterized protein n=1 Tax=Romanomermis culicivorax TaxID=13658 RepID=A0A915IBV0_ROMCU
MNWSNIKTMSDLLPFLVYQTLVAVLINICHIILISTNWSRKLDQKTVNVLMAMNLTRTKNNVVVPFRLDPALADDVLKNIWAEKMIVHKQRCVR